MQKLAPWPRWNPVLNQWSADLSLSPWSFESQSHSCFSLSWWICVSPNHLPKHPFLLSFSCPLKASFAQLLNGEAKCCLTVLLEILSLAGAHLSSCHFRLLHCLPLPIPTPLHRPFPCQDALLISCHSANPTQIRSYLFQKVPLPSNHQGQYQD